MDDGVDKAGKIQGLVREIIHHKIKNIVGRVEQYKDKYYLVSDNLKLGNYPVIIDGIHQVIEADEIYNATVSEYPTAEHAYFRVKLVNSIGKVGDDAVLSIEC